MAGGRRDTLITFLQDENNMRTYIDTASNAGSRQLRVNDRGTWSVAACGDSKYHSSVMSPSLHLSRVKDGRYKLLADDNMEVPKPKPMKAYYRGLISNRIYRQLSGSGDVEVFRSNLMQWRETKQTPRSLDTCRYTPVRDMDEYMHMVKAHDSPYSDRDLEVAFGLRTVNESAAIEVVVEAHCAGLCNESIRGMHADVIIMDDTHDPEPTPPPTLHIDRNMAAIIAAQPATVGYTPVNHSEINFNF